MFHPPANAFHQQFRIQLSEPGKASPCRHRLVALMRYGRSMLQEPLEWLPFFFKRIYSRVLDEPRVDDFAMSTAYLGWSSVTLHGYP
eukprot:6183704-Pleurochrysis_carterae.AAC.1